MSNLRSAVLLPLAVATAALAATAGAVGTIVVDNSSAAPLDVTVTPRPWKQARSGAVAPDRARSLLEQARSGAVAPDRARSLLEQVSVSARAFTLPAGARRSVTLTLKGKPAGGSLFGAVDVVGLPTAATKRRTSAS